MRKMPVFESRSLGFSSDLTLLAPIRPGLVSALDAVSYATRARRLLQALHAGRTRAHEQSRARLLSDAVERVAVIQSVRVVVLEEEQKILLTVSFDGNWQSYIRVLWQKVGALLDVIFCNAVDYPQARLSSYDTWAAWVSRVQVETHFFYGSADGSAHDLLFLRRQDRQRQREALPVGRELADTLAPAEQRASDMLKGRDPAIDDDLWPGHARMSGALLEQGLQGVAGLYRLADLYLPGTEDGATLQRAAHELLLEFIEAWDNQLFKSAMAHPGAKIQQRFERQLAWLWSGRPAPRRPALGHDQLPSATLRDVQGGILKGYDKLTHGALVLIAFDDAASAGLFLGHLAGLVTTAADEHLAAPGQVFHNLALSAEGLRVLGVQGQAWEELPEAFRQGMAARAGQLGDVQGNHPDRWQLPRAWPKGDLPIELSAVHAMVQLRARVSVDAEALGADATAASPLREAIAALHQPQSGVRVLAVEPMRRMLRPVEGQAEPDVIEHFGYADGNGQPGFGRTGQPPDYPGNNLPWGDVLLGHPGSGDVDVPMPGPGTPRWLDNSSFLALRRYRQHLNRFEDMLQVAQKAGLDAEELASKLMGRDRAGNSLVAPNRPPAERNRFTYRSDPEGQICPFHSHVRRANPRLTTPPVGVRQPRIVRRGMSFGPSRDEQAVGDEKLPRGLFFMAYGADLAEQFETVQRWLSGGNSTGTSSEPSCPLLGVPRAGQRRWLRYTSAAKEPVHAQLDGNGSLMEDAEPLVELNWGLYLLVPSLSTLAHLRLLSQQAGSARPLPWSAQRGRALLAQLMAASDAWAEEPSRQPWKLALEDAHAQDRWDSASVWAAVRQDHAGALRTPYGVLVAGHAQVMSVLQRPASEITVDGYQEAMRQSLGPIYLGRDDDGPQGAYRQESDPVNAAIGRLSGAGAVFELARRITQTRLDELYVQAEIQAELANAAHVECLVDPRDLIDELLAGLCEHWFGLQAGAELLKRGPMDWAWQPGQAVSYPGHFMNPSRYIFQPWPTDTVVERGRAHGAALRVALKRFLEPHVVAGTVPQTPDKREAPVAAVILGHPCAQGDADFMARTMAGAIMGFVPTLDGALRALALEWLRDDSFWQLRAAWAGQANEPEARKNLLRSSLRDTLSGRVVPDLIWRTAVAPFDLAPGLRVQVGDKLVLGLASAAHDAWERGLKDNGRVMFGGDRSKAGHPTHACPGYDAAMDAMLGFWSVLVADARPWRPLQGSSVLRVEVPRQARKFKRPSDAELEKALPRHHNSSTPLVMCWGDSWVDYRQFVFGKAIDLSVALGQRFRIDRSFADFNTWGHIRLLARGVNTFITALREVALEEPELTAVLISGGGNDSTVPTLGQLFRNKPVDDASLPTPAVFDPAKVAVHVGALMDHYRTVLNALASAYADPNMGFRKPVDVILHGYDHPQPGHGLAIWLWPAFDRLCSKKQAAQEMAWLIDAFNTGLRQVAGEFAFAHYVKLTGVLAQAQPADPTKLWENELHPTQDGFEMLASKLEPVILGIRAQQQQAAV